MNGYKENEQKEIVYIVDSISHTIISNFLIFWGTNTSFFNVIYKAI